MLRFNGTPNPDNSNLNGTSTHQLGKKSGDTLDGTGTKRVHINGQQGDDCTSANSPKNQINLQKGADSDTFSGKGWVHGQKGCDVVTAVNGSYLVYNGGKDEDTVVLPGSEGDYTIDKSKGRTTITNGETTVELKKVENIEYSGYDHTPGSTGSGG